MELRRNIQKDIEQWYKSGGKSALLIKGARQVGKTHIIRKVLSELQADYIEINLIQTPAAIGIFEKAETIEEIMVGLSVFSTKPLIKGKTVVFIDEVQKYKEMVTKIKFLVDEGSFRYVLSGSLLGVELTNLESAPVGYLTPREMYPLTFEEFLQITNISDDIKSYLIQCLKERKPVLEEVNRKMLALYNQYLIVGGMPEAVSAFAASYNVNEVLAIHDSIIKLYKLDFTQYENDSNKLILTNIYDLIPAELLKQNRRFIVSDIKKGLHYERVASSFLWLKNAGVALPVYNATEPVVPLKINEKQSLFKLYLSDVGMLTSIYGMNTKTRLLNEDVHLNAGGIFENAVVSELVNLGYHVYYYNNNRLGELDCVIEYDGNILPIEVKSGKDYYIHSALTHCVENENYEIKEAIVFANCNVHKEGKVVYLPVYMVTFLNKNNAQELVADRIEF